MLWLNPFVLMLIVARRELTTILRGKAERLLFIWTSLLFVPLLTVGLFTAFLLLRTTEILHPVNIAISRQQEPELRHLVQSLRAFPEVHVEVVDDPKKCFDAKTCDGIMTKTKDELQIVTHTGVQRRHVARAFDGAKLQAIKQLVRNENIIQLLPYLVVELSDDQYHVESELFRQSIIAMYVVAYLYSLLWLIPAIDIVRFDFLNNNLFPNVCLPVSMSVVVGGKLLSGIVMTLLPTLLSSIAFIGSMLIAGAVIFDYYAGGVGWDAVSFLPTFKFPISELLLLPCIVVFAVAVLHAWLMLVVYFFQGQRLAFFVSTNSLFVLGPLAVAYGASIPVNEVWPTLVPFFGLAAVVRQIADQQVNPISCSFAFLSTLLATAFLVWVASKCYTVESPIRLLFRRRTPKVGESVS